MPDNTARIWNLYNKVYNRIVRPCINSLLFPIPGTMMVVCIHAAPCILVMVGGCLE